ncbi:MAG: hypothetical protein WKG00_05030 [Polyangiaceae bacterium]
MSPARRSHRTFKPTLHMLTAMTLVFAGCAGAPTPSADGGDPARSSCQPLAKQCHAVSEGNPAAAACHELGHRGDEVACAREEARCHSACAAAARPGAGP